MAIETKSDMKQAILSQLSKGHKNALTGNILAKRLRLSGTREMRQVIKELRHNGYLIGLSVRNPRGYYLIDTVEELEGCMTILKGYCVEAAIARRDLKLAGIKLLNPYQISLL